MTGENGLAACELYTAALHFQMKRAMGQSDDRGQAWKACAICPSVMTAFKAALARGQTVARARLREQPTDDETRFLLGKLDLNYVWLQLGTLGRKTGWAEYKEAQTLARRGARSGSPDTCGREWRARGSTTLLIRRLPWGTRWLLGGGNKKRGLAVGSRGGRQPSRISSCAPKPRFALWDMQVREQDVDGARETARILVRDFPENQELRRFVGAIADPYDPQETNRTPD